MKTRKVVSAILAGACALSALSFSATAATSADKEVKSAGATTFKVTATPVAPAISVSVPSSVSAVINPYGVAVSDSKGVEYGEGGVSSAEYTIRNFTTTSNIAVNVEASLTVPTKVKETGSKETVPTITVSTDAKKAEDVADAKKTSSKTLIAWVIASDAAELTGDSKSLDADGEEKITVDVSADSAGDGILFTDVTALKDSDGKAVAAANDPGKGTLAVLPKATAAVAGDSDGTGAVDGKYGVVKFAISGVVSDNSVDAWTSSDKLTINLVLNLGPTAEDATTGN